MRAHKNRCRVERRGRGVGGIMPPVGVVPDMGDMPPPPVEGMGMEGMGPGVIYGGLVPPPGYRGMRRERRHCFGR